MKHFLKIIEKKIKTLRLSYKVKFITKPILKNIFEFNGEIMDKVKNSNKEIIEKNKVEDLNNNKSYRRKIKKKIIEN